MPSKSKKQARFMAAAAHNPKFAKKAGIPRRVAKEFHQSDRKVKMWMGGAGLAAVLKKETARKAAEDALKTPVTMPTKPFRARKRTKIVDPYNYGTRGEQSFYESSGLAGLSKIDQSLLDQANRLSQMSRGGRARR